MHYQSLFLSSHVSTIAGYQIMRHQIAELDDVVFLKIESDGSLQLYLFDDLMLQSKRSVSYHILFEKNAKLDFFISLINACDLELNIYLYLHANASQAEMLGLYALDQNQTLKIKTYQMHYGIQTKSSVVLHGMLKDQARADVQGLIFIDQLASKTQAVQENKNIVLSQKASVVSEPSIEVLNHDVQCSHGAAIGQFDKQHLWYLQSFGFDFQSAHQMLIQSFFSPIVQTFENKNECMEILCKKMI